MGLCKCERKRVTNLFCFEHRVNVCEFCLLSNHPRCVVKSYLCWLNDSEFSAVCTLCHEKFDSDNEKDCVRLTCLDLFHWECLDSFISRSPETTAPAGVLCPACGHSIFPHKNQGGPVAEALRTYLGRSEWASARLSGSASVGTNFNVPQINMQMPPSSGFNDHTPHEHQKLLDPRVDSVARQFLNGDEVVRLPETSHPFPRDAQNVTHLSNLSSISDPHFDPSIHRQRRDHTEDSLAYDDDKYKRRFAFHNLLPLFRTTLSFRLSWPKLRRRYTVVFIILFLIIFIILASRRHAAESDDPFYDPFFNPNIHMGKGPPGVVVIGNRGI